MEHAKKKDFIRELGKICGKYWVAGTVAMRYAYNEDTGTETVTIRYIGGKEITVDVTADSLDAMVLDIFRKI